MPRSFRTEIYIAIVFGIIFALFFYFLTANMQTFGHNIPAQNIHIEYFKGFAWSVFLFFVILCLPAPENERLSLLILWGLRSTVTLGFMLYYEYSYGLDAYSYYSSAMQNSAEAFHNFDFMNGTYMVMKFTSFLVRNVYFLDSYHALKVFWSFFGFLGSYIFYRAYTKYIGESQIHYLWVLQAFPSIIFWSSILGKDPLCYFGISLFFYSALNMLNHFRLSYIFMNLAGLFIIGCIRSWLMVLFLIPFMLIYFLKSNARIAYKSFLFCGLILLAGYYYKNILGSIDVATTEEIVSTVSTVSQSWNRGGSGQTTSALDSPAAIGLFLPKGMFAALFRPLPGEINNLFGILSGLENAFLLLSIIYVLSMRRLEIFKDLFMQYSFLTLFVWSIFYSVISYQNLGTAVRFKLQVLPILLLITAHARWISSKKQIS